jgi:hypothetical protein
MDEFASFDGLEDFDLEFCQYSQEPVIEYGQTHPDWVEFLLTFPSAVHYSYRVSDFLNNVSKSEDINSSDLVAKLKRYFHVNYALCSKSFQNLVFIFLKKYLGVNRKRIFKTIMSRNSRK